jgi:hypothetical protein
MSLQARAPMRPCGRRYASQEDALNSKRGRSGGFYPVACRDACEGFWHLRRKKVPAGITVKPAARDTGPDRKTRAIVLERDQCQCCACGKPVGMPGTWWSIQHRVARGQGGPNTPENLVTLCGSATSDGCHRKAEDRDEHMHAQGFWLRSDEDPAQEPIMLASEHGSGITVWLTRDGGYALKAPGRVA